MQMMSQVSKALAGNRSLTSICFFLLATVTHAEESPTKYLPLMVAINGKHLNLIYIREVSHPNLVELEKIPSETQPECANVAIVRALSTKPSKSLIWVSAKD
jgi:hypothetical protein